MHLSSYTNVFVLTKKFYITIFEGRHSIAA